MATLGDAFYVGDYERFRAAVEAATWSLAPPEPGPFAAGVIGGFGGLPVHVDPELDPDVVELRTADGFPVWGRRLDPEGAR